MAALKPLFDIVNGFEGFEFWAFWLGVFIVFTAAGFIIDMLMGRQGFGPFLNAIFAIVGVCLGLYLRYNYFFKPPYLSYEPYVTMGLCFGCPALLLVILSLIRGRLGG